MYMLTFIHKANLSFIYIFKLIYLKKIAWFILLNYLDIHEYNSKKH